MQSPITQKIEIEKIGKLIFHSIQHCAQFSWKWEQNWGGGEGFCISLLETGPWNLLGRYHRYRIQITKALISFSTSQVPYFFFDASPLDKIWHIMLVVKKIHPLTSSEAMTNINIWENVTISQNSINFKHFSQHFRLQSQVIPKNLYRWIIINYYYLMVIMIYYLMLIAIYYLMLWLNIFLQVPFFSR